MKKFLLHIIYFLLPLAGISLLIFFQPVNKEDAYNYIQDDCYGRSSWFYERIFKSEKPVDIVFLGSSHTICSVQDSLLEVQLSAAMKHPVYPLNTGYCRLGISLQYVLLKDILSQKKPEMIVFEIREQEDFFSHDMFPYTASTKDVFTAPLFFNRDYFTDIHQAFLAKIGSQRARIYKTISTPDTLFSEFGFWPRGEIASEETLIKKEHQQVRQFDKRMHAFQQKMNLSYSEEYVRRMTDFCKKKNINYVFLFLPAYGNNTHVPVNDLFYKELGTVLTPPAEILRNKSNWSDEGHLNVSGATEITNWLSEVLNDYLLSQQPLSK